MAICMMTMLTTNVFAQNNTNVRSNEIYTTVDFPTETVILHEYYIGNIKYTEFHTEGQHVILTVDYDTKKRYVNGEFCADCVIA